MLKITKCPSCGSPKNSERSAGSGPENTTVASTRSKNSNSMNVPNARSKSTIPKPCGLSKPSRQPSQNLWPPAADGRSAASAVKTSNSAAEGGPMNCFNHRDKPAIGLCKSCGKALCEDCLTEVPNGLACKGSCEDRVNMIEPRHRVRFPSNERAASAPSSAQRRLT